MLESIRTALVTGASGGIGEAFARQLAALGKDLILMARSEEKLAALAGELAAQHGVQAHVIAADLARHEAARAIFDETERLGLEVDLLINNAGFGKGGTFVELPYDIQADMLRLNVNTLMELTRLYLPAICRRNRGGVINLGSNASFQPVPTMAVYGATKAFVLSFSEALAAEVEGDGVRIMALCPGATATGFWETSGVWPDRWTSLPTPDEVVADALRAYERGQWTFVHGFMNRFLAFLASRLLPRRLVARLAFRFLE
jgi:short-subunit dehydrogenase